MISNKAKKEILKQNVRASFPYLIEIIDNDTNEKFRYANCDENVIYNKEVYEAAFFIVQPPEQTYDKIGDGRLTLSIIDTQWIRRIRQQKNKRFSIVFVALMDYMENGTRVFESLSSWTYILTLADWSETEVTWTMKFDDNMDIMMPVDKMTELICPGLV